MDLQKAIEALQATITRDNGFNPKIIQELDMVIQAAKKQIAQKRVGEEGYPNCPSCGKSLIGEYCYECGQRTLKP